MFIFWLSVLHNYDDFISFFGVDLPQKLLKSKVRKMEVRIKTTPVIIQLMYHLDEFATKIIDKIHRIDWCLFSRD